MEIKIDKKNKFLLNLLSKKYNSNIINNKNFPKDTKYEKELNTNFKYFNVLWYDPNYSNNLDLFKKCFEHVQFYRGDDFYSTINFFKKESISEWIVVTPGSLGKELILNLESFQCIKAFFIYCDNPQFHDWAKKIKKVKCITSDLEILCKKFIELNNSYFYPNFNYSSKEDNNSNQNNNLEYSVNKNFALIKEFREKRNKINDKYNNLCIKFINYLDKNDDENELRNPKEKENLFLNVFTNFFGEKIDKSFFDSFNELTIDMAEILILISLYFSKYPYLLNILSYQEVKNLIKVQLDTSKLYETQDEIFCKIEQLYAKIINNESILDEKDKIKEIQIFIIQMIFYTFKQSNKTKFFNEEYYQIINFLRDIDFCLKLYLIIYLTSLCSKKVNFINEIVFALNVCEPRYPLYVYYFYQFCDLNKFNEKEKIIINDSLKINDFIVVGDKYFHDKIKIIEKNIKSKSFKYLNINQIEDYIDEKKKDIHADILTYFYFLIIRYEEYNENFEKIIALSFKTGVTFLVFLYIENEKKFYKNNMNFLIPTILVYSPEDIIIYLKQNLNFYNPFDFPNPEDLGEYIDIKIPKITFEQNEDDKYQNGCFELSETFDINLIRNKYMLRLFDDIDFASEFSKHVYNIYKDYNALDLFYSQNCLYFGWKLYPELTSFNICFVKRFLYMYCREEEESQKSFYRMINDDLRSREPSKIYRYINILALINQIIEENNFSNYKGVVYRATKLDEKLILKLVAGTKMVNTTFWSTSKDSQVADRFMKAQSWRNAYIICKTFKNNIDIDLEKLNPFSSEKEVLFLPFTEFIVEKISSEEKFKKKVYIIKLKELGNKNFVNSDNMQIENINNVNVANNLDELIKNQVENIKDELVKNIKPK